MGVLAAAAVLAVAALLVLVACLCKAAGRPAPLLQLPPDQYQALHADIASFENGERP